MTKRVPEKKNIGNYAESNKVALVIKGSCMKKGGIFYHEKGEQIGTNQHSRNGPPGGPSAGDRLPALTMAGELSKKY